MRRIIKPEPALSVIVVEMEIGRRSHGNGTSLPVASQTVSKRLCIFVAYRFCVTVLQRGSIVGRTVFYEKNADGLGIADPILPVWSKRPC